VVYSCGFIFSFLVFAGLPVISSREKLSQSSAYSSIFYDRDGKVLYEVYKDKNRLPVSFNEIPDSLKKATISIEDKNFYKHKGISELGIIRAVLSILFRGAIQGGSTITQQLIKNVLLNSSQTASRKIKEWILAVEVERRYTKDQILEKN
jgi:membrane peptidoglycan carboxypeptidase